MSKIFREILKSLGKEKTNLACLSHVQSHLSSDPGDFYSVRDIRGEVEESALRGFWHEFGPFVSSFQQCVVTDVTLSLL